MLKSRSFRYCFTFDFVKAGLKATYLSTTASGNVTTTLQSKQ